MSGTLISLLETGPKGRFEAPTPRFPPVDAAATLAATSALAWAAAAWAAGELGDNEELTKPPPIPGGKTGFFASGSPANKFHIFK